MALHNHLARTRPGRDEQRLSFGIGLIGFMWGGSDGRVWEKRVLLWAKDFTGGFVYRSFCGG